MDARILMVTPNWRWDSSALPVDTLCPPAGIPLEFAYLSADLGGHVAKTVFDGYLTDARAAALTAAVAAFQPTAVVVSTTPSLLYWRCPPMTVEAVRAAVSAVRSGSAAPVVLIGPHGTFSPAWTIARTGADACWRGAPERGLAPLLRHGLTGTSTHLAREGQPTAGQIAVLPAARLPPASFAGFASEPGYPPHAWCVTPAEQALLGAHRGALLEASRGCPWACAYCAKGPVRDRYERRPVALVASELAELRACGVTYVFFIDETFNLPGRGLDELLTTLASAGIRFGFQGRADLVTPDQADGLAAAGCVYAELGVDVVSDPLARAVGRRQHLDRCEQGIENARSAIPLVRFNRLNLRTLDYRALYGAPPGPDWDFPPDPAYPYPGSPLGEALMARYGHAAFDWPFAQRYSWWLRIEVHLQRNRPDLSDPLVAELQRAFLELSPPAAEAVARAFEPLATPVPDFPHANKSVKGVGPGVRVRHSGA